MKKKPLDQPEQDLKDNLSQTKIYINKLWEGIEERPTHFDSDSTTSWSEAPAERIFSILQTTVEHKNAIKLPNRI